MTIEPSDLGAVLYRLAWSREPMTTERAPFEIWQSPDGALEAFVPLDQSAGDYQGLLDRAVGLVRSSDPVVFDRFVREQEMKRDADLAETTWRKETPAPPGLITWLSGEEMHLLARDQLVASAKATVERRAYYGSRSAYLAKNFIDSSFMAAPAAGSFIVTALSPLGRSFYISQAAENRATAADARLVDPERVSGREILKTYEVALDALQVCLADYAKAPRIEPFVEAVSSGVSYELTKSLSELVAGGDTAVVISRGQSQGREVVFEAPTAQVLARATTALSRDPEPIDATLTGEVTLLSRSVGGGDRVIRLDVMTGGGGAIGKARVRLNAEQYEMALEAHREEAPLLVRGELSREGNLYWMYRPDRVSIVAPEIQPASTTTSRDFDQPELPSEGSDGPT
ncbi:hypothetical protein SAMN04489867_3156 [Pedococcus dokdonensis]|uniref:Uncharacterized protein n=1 Tax=Pedococcus dokdonensis TaxID=443156 RepID=A0A1H0U6B5_9MICO|nr:hypothetical protein [Pedococcus dokdonensis]SDP61743.1 hypothetical protein SAMN04489867_3156 [Pedococcus dokdonensis]